MKIVGKSRKQLIKDYFPNTEFGVAAPILHLRRERKTKKYYLDLSYYKTVYGKGKHLNEKYYLTTSEIARVRII